MSQFDAVMPEDADDDVDENPDDQSNLRRQLRQSQKSNKALAAQLEEAKELRKENAFLKAGLPDTPVTRLYQNTYAAEDFSVEAIQAGAAELGIIPGPDAQTQADIATIESQSAAMSGSTPTMAADSQEAMWKEFTEALQKGADSEAVLRKWGVSTASDNR